MQSLLTLAYVTEAPVRLVREQAFKAMQLFVKKLEEHAASMVCDLPHSI